MGLALGDLFQNDEKAAPKPGYKEWTGEITVPAGSELKLAATLEKQN